MAFGDVWAIRDPDPRWGSDCLLMELCPHPTADDRRPVVTVVVIEGSVRYMDRMVGVGGIGPFIPEETKVCWRVWGPVDGR